MAGSVVVSLHRNNVNESWGFRLQGGRDYRQALSIKKRKGICQFCKEDLPTSKLYAPLREQKRLESFLHKVQPQSPASHCLSPGDNILSIGNTNAQHLTHMQAHQLIKSAGNMLQLTLEKCGGGDIDRLRPKNPVKFSPWKHPQPNYA